MYEMTAVTSVNYSQEGAMIINVKVVEAFSSLPVECYSLLDTLERHRRHMSDDFTWNDVDMSKNALVELEETRYFGTGPRFLSSRRAGQQIERQLMHIGHHVMSNKSVHILTLGA